MERVFGRKLKSVMIQKCVGVEELARLSGVKSYRISELLSTDVSKVRLATLGKLSRALDIPYLVLSMRPSDITKEN